MPRPSSKGYTVSRAQQLIAEHSNRMDESVEEYDDDDVREQYAPGTKPTVSHVRPGRVRVWFLTPHGSVPRWVSSQSLGGIEGVLSNGASPVCHDCGSDQCGETINDCPGRPKRQYRICPVGSCGKRVYDPKPTGKFLMQDGMASFEDGDEVSHDDMVIQDDSYTAATTEIRTKVMLDLHIIGFHEQEAMQMGVRAPEFKSTLGRPQVAV